VGSWVAAAASPEASPVQGCPDLPIQNHHLAIKRLDTSSEHPLPPIPHRALCYQSCETPVRCKG